MYKLINLFNHSRKNKNAAKLHRDGNDSSYIEEIPIQLINNVWMKVYK